MLAHITKVTELELSEEESKAMGEAIVRVTEQYDVPMPDAKTLAWVNLAKVLGMVYGPRFGAVRVRKSGKKPGPEPVVISPFHQTGA